MQEREVQVQNAELCDILNKQLQDQDRRNSTEKLMEHLYLPNSEACLWELRNILLENLLSFNLLPFSMVSQITLRISNTQIQEYIPVHYENTYICTHICSNKNTI